MPHLDGSAERSSLHVALACCTVLLDWYGVKLCSGSDHYPVDSLHWCRKSLLGSASRMRHYLNIRAQFSVSPLTRYAVPNQEETNSARQVLLSTLTRFLYDRFSFLKINPPVFQHMINDRAHCGLSTHINSQLKAYHVQFYILLRLKTKLVIYQGHMTIVTIAFIHKQ